MPFIKIKTVKENVFLRITLDWHLCRIPMLEHSCPSITENTKFYPQSIENYHATLSVIKELPRNYQRPIA